MISNISNPLKQQTTSYKVVVPFFIYAAIIFLLSTVLLFFSGSSFMMHYFNPHELALTHLFALGWGTMIIIGAGHQMIPVLTGGKLYSNNLAILTFVIIGTGIPLLTGGFYFFAFGTAMLSGAILVTTGILFFTLNIFLTISKGKENVHAVFLFTSSLWLLLTALLGLSLVINFIFPFLKTDSLIYLPVHAHMGIIGWFLMLVIGVASRLIPLFLISKYTSTKILWTIFFLLNIGLIGFIVDSLFFNSELRFKAYAILIIAGIILFAYYCYKAFRQRIRRSIDPQLKLSMVAVIMMFIPALVMGLILLMTNQPGNDFRLFHLYGFAIFIGWITAMILGMTFKTFPFIIWNKVYAGKSSKGSTPSPKDLFSGKLFQLMFVLYVSGFFLSGIAIYIKKLILIQSGALFLIIAALLYCINIFKIAFQKPKMI
ncbi:hypothetical protein BH09BAC5_BH09BAC5_02990 [soil metagenome]